MSFFVDVLVSFLSVVVVDDLLVSVVFLSEFVFVVVDDDYDDDATSFFFTIPGWFLADGHTTTADVYSITFS